MGAPKPAPNSDKDPDGGKGGHKGGKSPVSATSYEGRRGKPASDKGGGKSGK